MLVYPNLDPVAFQIGPFKVYWYGVMYLLSFLWISWLAERSVKNRKTEITKEVIEASFNAALIGVLLGGRLGYLLLYGTGSSIWKIWEGGMSFHGGLVGSVIGIYLIAYSKGQDFVALLDFWAPLVPIGLALGRLGNFINGELWGRITNVPWGMVYPHVDLFLRHPSQLYELLLEGVGLFLLLNGVKYYKPRRGILSGLFLIGYGIGRLICECFREPDPQIGYLASYFTLGQLLTLPLIIVGGYLLRRGSDE